MLIHMAQGNPVGIMQNIRYFIINLCLSIARRLIGDKKDSGDDVDVRPVFKIVIHIKDHEPIEITTFDIYDDFVKMYVDSLYESGLLDDGVDFQSISYEVYTLGIMEGGVKTG